MNPRSRNLSLALLVVVLVGAGLFLRKHFQEAHSHEHAHGEPSTAALALNEGKRWETDLPLRTGMQRIRDAASPALAAHAKRSLAPNDAKALAASIQQNVNYLIENCKLEPKADAALHVLITDLLRGGASLAENPASDEGAALIAKALRQYGEYFNHPDWKPVAAAG